MEGIKRQNFLPKLPLIQIYFISTINLGFRIIILVVLSIS